MIIDLLKETIWSLAGNKVRSGLTILGIVIGIASVITMVAIGKGSQASIQGRIQSIGSNLIMITPGEQRTAGISAGQGSAQSLKLEDAKAIGDAVQNVAGVAPEDTHRYQVTAKGNNTNTQIIGTVPDYVSVRNLSIDSGTFLTAYQEQTSAKVAVLGPGTRDDLFGVDVDPVGQTIRIKNIDFQVIGLTVSKGGTGFNNADDAVYVPLSTSQHYLSGNAYLTTISVSAENSTILSTVQSDLTDLLLEKHGISDSTKADFSTINQADIIATASSITNTFTILLASIAGISLLVGGIGIMNMMLTTVTERTREIGLRKAVGIRKLYINLQFLSEAVVLTFLGGAVGVFLGWMAALAVTKFAGLATQVSLSTIFLAFGVSAGVGIIFGFYPARRAANLSPIEALRYE